MRAITIAAIAVTAVVAAGCGGGDKAGGSGGPVTLTLATDEFGSRPATRAIEEFAARVRELSGGTVRIEPVFRASGNPEHDWDQRVARKVVSGHFDMGMIPARTWDTEGVTTLRALHAPFLVTSDALVEQIVTSDIAGEMLSGLDEKGIVGLALVPDGLRHPFAFGNAMRSPGDFVDKGIWSPRSDVSYELLEALGAKPDDTPVSVAAIADGSLAAGETSFVLAADMPDSTATGNVTFFPKVNSLVINEGAWDELSGDQREALREAARRTVDWARGANVPEPEAASRFCEAGGRVVLADATQLKALAEAARPVREQLEADRETKDLIARIGELKAQVGGSAPVSPCGPTPSPTATRAERSGGGPIPNGVYRNVSEKAALLAAGIDASEAAGYNGLHTITLEDGKLEDVLKSDQGFPPCLGSYTSTRSTIEVSFEVECNGGFTAKWTLEDGELRFTDIHSPDPEEDRIVDVVFGTDPFKKID
jgi:TRAP-type C4-dicarboxylate transport system substrate-binding protein